MRSRGLVTHQAERIGADVGLADIVAEDDEDIRFLSRCRLLCSTSERKFWSGRAVAKDTVHSRALSMFLAACPTAAGISAKSDHAPASYAVTEAAVVRMVYEHYTVQSLGIGAITRLLNEEGVPTRKRISSWERSTVWAMLRNPAGQATIM
jgi:hypothetical protein